MTSSLRISMEAAEEARRHRLKFYNECVQQPTLSKQQTVMIAATKYMGSDWFTASELHRFVCDANVPVSLKSIKMSLSALANEGELERENNSFRTSTLSPAQALNRHVDKSLLDKYVADPPLPKQAEQRTAESISDITAWVLQLVNREGITDLAQVVRMCVEAGYTAGIRGVPTVTIPKTFTMPQ